MAEYHVTTFDTSSKPANRETASVVRKRCDAAFWQYILAVESAIRAQGLADTVAGARAQTAANTIWATGLDNGSDRIEIGTYLVLIEKVR